MTYHSTIHLKKLHLFTGLALALITPTTAHAQQDHATYTAQTNTLTPVAFDIPKVEPITTVEYVTDRPRTDAVPKTAGEPSSTDGLTGSVGYARPGGNCTQEPGINNPGYGNPISWPATSLQPRIGATALFTYNHVGVISGIWSNGDLEIRHQNYRGSQHRFPRSSFRGYR